MTEAIDITLKAGGDLSAKQYHFVKLSADYTVVICAAATDKALGVLQNDPVSGAAAIVRVIGRTKVSSDAALSVNDFIGTQSDGQADAKVPGTDTTEYVLGIVCKASGAADDIAEAILFGNTGRGA